MPNGKPGDNPLTDILVHGMTNIPQDIVKMIDQMHKRNRNAFTSPEYWQKLDEWEHGENLDEGREFLRNRLGMRDELK